MFKTALPRKNHGQSMFVAGCYYFLIADGSAGLNYSFYPSSGQNINAVPERKKGIGTQDAAG